VDDKDQTFVAWPAVVESPVVEASRDLIQWERLFDEAPPNNRFAIPEAFDSGTRFFRLRYVMP
jgi:hypothetical protein